MPKLDVMEQLSHGLTHVALGGGGGGLGFSVLGGGGGGSGFFPRASLISGVADVDGDTLWVGTLDLSDLLEE